MRVKHSATIDAASAAQQQAADPRVSVWVSANAGTGKTTVLVTRLMRLMIAEPAAKPEEILGLTYSKAGAAQMLDKLMAQLAALARLDETALEIKLTEILLRVPTSVEKERARTLVQLVLDTPPALMTIHSFCAQVLARFPLEAGVSPGFVLWEEKESETAMLQALNETLVALAEPDASAYGAFQHVMAHLAETSLHKILKSLLAQRARLQRLLVQYGGVDAYLEALAQELGVEMACAHQPLEEDWAAYVPCARTQTLLKDAVDVLAQGAVTAQKIGTALCHYLALPEHQKQRTVDVYIKQFLTKDDTARPTLMDKPLREKYPDVENLLRSEQERLFKLKQTFVTRATFVHTAALLRVADVFLQRYTQLKEQAGALDFEDLIQRTRHLLHQSTLQEWIRYRLDRTLKHVLLDEGQDTNFRQWDILKALVTEFFTGESETPRTLFAVGDMKQSIFRFQEAQPQVFQNIWTELKKWDVQGNRALAVPLKTSFRSAPAILNVVDQVFKGPLVESLTEGVDAVEHGSPYPDAAGEITLWPPFTQDKAVKEDTPWLLPAHTPFAETARAQLVEKVARTAYQLANSGQILACTGRRIDYGDMMILLRSRASLPALLAACQKAGVPVVVGAQPDTDKDPVVLDILALCRCVADPCDDLALAQVLKSPFMNQNETLFAQLVAVRQEAETLADVLRRVAPALAEQILQWQALAAEMSVYALLVKVFQETQARGAFVARFGGGTQSEAGRQALQQKIDAFLDAALAHGCGGWHSFVQQITAQGISGATGAGEGGDAVRILTAHGAKGLEAPIVFMPDTMGDYTSKIGDEKWLWDEEKWLLYAPSGKLKTPLHQRLKEAEERRMIQDGHRLLYVALTRAEERLYIGGALQTGRRKIPENCWYADVAACATSERGWLVQEDGSRVFMQGDVPTQEQADEERSAEQATLPAWAHQPVARPCAGAGSSVETKTVEQRTGEQLHHLLEVLPMLPEGRWEEVVAQVLSAWPDDKRRQALVWVKAVVQAYPWMFGPQSRAEIALYDGQGLGRMDRLVVDDDTVCVIDFKTAGVIPVDMPETYRQQVTRYARVVAEVYPAKKVQAGILWLTFPLQEHRLDWVDFEG